MKTEKDLFERLAGQVMKTEQDLFERGMEVLLTSVNKAQEMHDAQIKKEENMSAEKLTGNQIPKFRLIVLKKGIEMEAIGLRMTRNSRSALSIVKQEFGWKGNRQTILDKLTEVIDSMPDTP